MTDYRKISKCAHDGSLDLNTSALHQIASHANRMETICAHYMHSDEIKAFADLRDAINVVLQMQSGYMPK